MNTFLYHKCRIFNVKSFFVCLCHLCKKFQFFYLENLCKTMKLIKMRFFYCTIINSVSQSYPIVNIVIVMFFKSNVKVKVMSSFHIIFVGWVICLRITFFVTLKYEYVNKHVQTPNHILGKYLILKAMKKMYLCFSFHLDCKQRGKNLLQVYIFINEWIQYQTQSCKFFFSVVELVYFI